MTTPPPYTDAQIERAARVFIDHVNGQLHRVISRADRLGSVKGALIAALASLTQGGDDGE